MCLLFSEAWLLILISYMNLVSSLDPISGISLASFGALGSIYFGMQVKFPISHLYRFSSEGQCYRKFDVNRLKLNIRNNVFGQHLVSRLVPDAVNAHIQNKYPKKALVMAFHGWTGSGKNHVAKILADNLYEGQSRNRFVHWYIANKDFPHAGNVKKYREKLMHEITEKTKLCDQSLFIFDEVDKIAPGILDGLKSYLDYYGDIDGVDYRKNIYVFLSNAGGNEITRIALNFWLDGKEREDITTGDIELLIAESLFDKEGAFQSSDILKRNLIDVYVPFFPLEQIHVQKCISAELHTRGLEQTHDKINVILQQINFYPPEIDLFSTSGCKKVSHKVDIYGYE